MSKEKLRYILSVNEDGIAKGIGILLIILATLLLISYCREQIKHPSSQPNNDGDTGYVYIE